MILKNSTTVLNFVTALKGEIYLKYFYCSEQEKYYDIGEALYWQNSQN